ncbi:response regulator transcription factor [Thiosocius teredinicola]|uniref:response regulator transcription factor n=1 Tax=Thiosocius teredinicola TaxID=1973002 RepID=UPI000990A73C
MNASFVYIVEDDAAVRDALVTLVRSVGLNAIAFDSADAFLDAMPRERVACILTDICMPGTDGMTLQRVMNDKGIDIPLIAISAHGDIAMAVEMVKRGAIDFIEKPFRNQVVLDRIREALQVAEAQNKDSMRQRGVVARLESLTPREHEVMSELIEGVSNKAIARRLSLSPRTVETHRAHILRKMEVESVTALVVLLKRVGVLDNAP